MQLGNGKAQRRHVVGLFWQALRHAGHGQIVIDRQRLAHTAIGGHLIGYLRTLRPLAKTARGPIASSAFRRHRSTARRSRLPWQPLLTGKFTGGLPGSRRVILIQAKPRTCTCTSLTGFHHTGVQVTALSWWQLILRTHITQHPMQGTEQEIVHQTAIAETHFVLGRVNVNVDQLGIKFQVQHKGRLAAVIQHIAIGLLDGVHHQLVAHRPAVHKEILHIGLRAAVGWQRNPAFQRQSGHFGIDMHRVVDELRRQQGRHPAFFFNAALRRPQLVNHLAVVAQAESHVVATQRQLLQVFFQVVEFGFFRAQEFAAGWRVEEQITYFQRCAGRVRCWRHIGGHITAFGLHLPGQIGVFCTRRQSQSRYRTDRRQRLAAKTHGHNRFQIVEGDDLAGCMAAQCQRQVVLANATAIVTHAQQLYTALLGINVNAVGTGIQGVFDQFLDDVGRTLDHLASSNLVSEARRQ